MSPELQQQLATVVQELGVQLPLQVGGNSPTVYTPCVCVCLRCTHALSVQPTDPSTPVSLVQGRMATFEPSQCHPVAGVVPWSPPQVNWNPWISSNIDEGPLAYVSFYCFFLLDFLH